MGTMPIKSLLLTMSIPIMISMGIQALYNIVDSIYVAQINEDALTAVSLVFPIQNFMIAACVGTGVGINTLASRYLGRKDGKMARQTANTGLLLSFVTYAIFLLIGIFLTDTYFNTQTDIPRIQEYGKTYMKIVTCFSIGISIQITMERILTATGKTMYTMLIQSVGAIVNIILDPILIFGYFGIKPMGVVGAAVATVIGQFCSMTLGIIINQRYNKELKFVVKEIFNIDFKLIKKIYAIAIPSAVMISIASIAVFFFNKILMKFSPTAVAFYGIYFKLQSIVFMPVFGITNGMLPIISYNFGAGNKERFKETVKTAIIYSYIITILGFIAFQFFPRQLLNMFNASPEMMAIGIVGLRRISYIFIVVVVSIVYATVFQALGDSMYALVVSLIRQLVILVPLAYAISLFGKLDNIWYAYVISETIDLILTLALSKKSFKKVEQLPDQEEIKPNYKQRCNEY